MTDIKTEQELIAEFDKATAALLAHCQKYTSSATMFADKVYAVYLEARDLEKENANA